MIVGTAILAINPEDTLSEKEYIKKEARHQFRSNLQVCFCALTYEMFSNEHNVESVMELKDKGIYRKAIKTRSNCCSKKPR